MPADIPPPSTKSRLFDLFLIAALVVYAVSAILLFWRQPYLLALLLLPAPLALVLRLGPFALAIAAAGAVIGPATEAACVAGGLWGYTERAGWQLIPPWLLVIWACFPTALWLIVRSLQGEVPQPEKRAFLFCLVAIALQIALYLALSQNLPLILAASFLYLGAILLVAPKESRIAALILMAAGALLGPICEALPVAAGAWAYARPDIFGMPLWLPLAYALFAVLVAASSLSFAGQCWQEKDIQIKQKKR